MTLLEAIGEEEYIEIEVPPRKGSAQIALGLDSPFDQYLFIDQRRNHIRQLETMIEQGFSHLRSRCILRNEDANSELCKWCRTVDWKNNRAVVFLDPYGMQVEWKTVETLAATRGIDLWYLFPLATLARMLPQNGIISPAWRSRIDASIGTSDWADHFYPESMFESLIDGTRIRFRDASVEKLRTFINARLSTCFVAVAEGLVLRNSKGSPMFLFCFAASNAAGAPTALKIAEDILNPRTQQGNSRHAL
jgi:three-Cys-motif partner protein